MSACASPSVLIVEDDTSTRDLFRIALRLAGFEVIAVADGVEALRLIEIDPPAAIVLDLGLLTMSGADVALDVLSRDATCHIPVIVVTGQDAMAIENTVACVLRKPIDPELVVDAVRRRLAIRFKADV